MNKCRAGNRKRLYHRAKTKISPCGSRTLWEVPAAPKATPCRSSKKDMLPTCSAVSPRSFIPRFTAILALFALFLVTGPSAPGATQYWDINGPGTWNTSASDWSPNSTGGSDGAFATNNDAVFSSSAVTTSGTITITTTTLSVDSITFAGANSGGYTFTNGGTITLGNVAGNTGLTLNPGTGNVLFQGTVVLADNTGNATFGLVDNSSNSLTFNNAFTYPNQGNNDTTLAISGTGAGGITFNGGFNGNNNGNLGDGFDITLGGSGPVNLNASSGGAGIATLASGATLNINAGAALQGFELNMTDSTSTVNFGPAVTSSTFAGLTGGGNLVLTNSSGAAVSLTLQGVGGSGGLNVSGTGTAANRPTENGNISGLGGVTITSVTINNRNNGGTATFNGNLTFSGALIVSNTGSGFPGGGTSGGNETVILTGINSYGGATLIGAGATLDVGTGGGFGGSTGSLGAGATTDNGTLVFNTTLSSSVAGISGTGSVTLSATNTSGLTITGSGSSFTGSMSVQGGSLTLGGNGTSTSLGTGVTVSNAGTVFNVMPGVAGPPPSPAHSRWAPAPPLAWPMGTSTFQVPSATLGGSNSLTFDLGGSSSDLLNITGVGTDGAGETISLNALSALSGTSFSIISAGSGLTPGNFTLLTTRFTSATGDMAYSLALTGSSTGETILITGSGIAAAYYTGFGGTSALNATTNGTTNYSSSPSGSPNLTTAPSNFTDIYFSGSNVDNIRDDLLARGQFHL